MTCEKWRELIEEESGAHPLAAELTAHLDSCEDCGRYHEEIKLALSALSADDDCTININIDIDAERFLSEVNTKIDRHSSSVRNKPLWPIRPMWPKLLTAAAIVLFMVGSLVMVNEYRISDKSDSSHGSGERNLVADLIGSDNSDESIDGTSIEVVLSEIGPDDRYSIEEAIIEGLSDDEMEYLEQNFQVGDLL